MNFLKTSQLLSEEGLKLNDSDIGRLDRALQFLVSVKNTVSFFQSGIPPTEKEFLVYSQLTKVLPPEDISRMFAQLEGHKVALDRMIEGGVVVTDTSNTSGFFGELGSRYLDMVCAAGCFY